MDEEVIFLDFELNELSTCGSSGLVLVEILREDIGSPGVCLTPLLVLFVEELQSKDALAELVHHVGPQQRLNRLSVS